jgi:uncharacterized protein (TIGR01777 family)
MRVAITGASGLIGRRLCGRLRAAGHTLALLGRQPGGKGHNGVERFQWTADSAPPPESLASADAIVHLAGEPVAQRWTAAAKQRIRSSRVEGTRRLLETIAALPNRPAALVSASAIGYYGERGDEVLTEDSSRGAGFLADVCEAWETEAARAADLGVRAVWIRNGIVLAPEGGALARMLPPFRAFVGGRLGSGRQWMSWIHIEDLVRLIEFALTAPVRGPLNGTAPHPVTNAEFTRALAGALRRPAVFPVPAFAAKALFGEMSEIVLASQRVLPVAAQTAGFSFQHEHPGAALQSLLQS